MGLLDTVTSLSVQIFEYWDNYYPKTKIASASKEQRNQKLSGLQMDIRSDADAVEDHRLPSNR